MEDGIGFGGGHSLSGGGIVENGKDVIFAHPREAGNIRPRIHGTGKGLASFLFLTC